LQVVKNNVFKISESIYIWNPIYDIKNLINIDVEDKVDKNGQYIGKKWTEYYKSFQNFIKCTTKLNKQDITETDIVYKWKKFKRKILGL
jgi:hypothetical protein